MTGTVSSASIAGMVFTLCMAAGIPIAALLAAKRRTQGSPRSVLIGAGTFVVFALILERILHAAVFSACGEKLTGNLWLYALYGGLAAGLFEETGRLLSMRFLMKKTLSRENAVMYGIGHGGAESVILIGLTYVSNIATAVLINTGKLDALLAGLDESMRAQTLERLSALWTTPAHLFCLAGLERAAAFALQICLSYLVYRAVKGKKPALFLLAIAIHFVVDAGLVLLAGMVSVYVVEGVLVVAVILLSILVSRRYKAEAA